MMRKPRTNFGRCAAAALTALLVVIGGASPAAARTITLTDEDGEKSAMIAADAPRQSWAGYEVSAGIWTGHMAELMPNRAFLLRIALDKIPKGMKITKAELLAPVIYVNPAEPRMYTWRLTSDWGPGVCWKYSTCRPEKKEWAMPGARGGSSDRATKPTAVTTTKTVAGHDNVVNVTPDVELWYNGAAPNYGWMFTVEEQVMIRCSPPSYTTRGSWKLRVTYEPQ